MPQYNSNFGTENISVKETANNRLNKHTKLVKCSFCDTTKALKPFKNNYICTDCISYLKDFTTT